MPEWNRSSRRKRPRFSDEMIQDCLRTIQSGEIEEMFEIIPRIGVLRDPRFCGPLLALLLDKDPKRREFAAYALGAMGGEEFLEPLKKAFHEAQKMRGFGAEEVQIAVIEAIGAIGDDAAVEFFLPMLRASGDNKSNKIPRWIVESLGTIAQQGGKRSLDALLELTGHPESEIRCQAISELSVAYWHHPQDVPDETLDRLCGLTYDANPAVSESALAAIQSLADVGCERAERLFCGLENS